MSNEYQVNAHLSKEDADEFIKENPYNFNEEEINVTKNFKKHVKSNFLIIVGFDKDYFGEDFDFEHLYNHSFVLSRGRKKIY